MSRVAAAAAIATLSLVAARGVSPRTAAAVAQGFSPAKEPEARALCGTVCHAFPPPSILPRSAWRNTVARMTLFRDGVFDIPGPPGTEGKQVTLPPDMARVLAYYEADAPAALPPPARWPAPASGRLRFQRRSLAPPLARSTPAISNVRLLDLDGDKRLELVACDMRHGLVLRGRPYDPEAQLDILMDVPHPARAEMVDLDRDGIRDLLVADLGSFLPADHRKGAVVWLRGLPGGKWAPYSMGDLPRVADVQAADFDGDGDLDVAVAAFGWRQTGEMILMENRTTDAAKPVFERRPLDARTGTIHVPPVDLNRDGRPDIVALISQQHETVVALLNQGGGRFKTETIYTAPHPNWGSSGIHVVDLDRDGDLDVLLAHGDSFDDYILKPYHGITWLENEGTFPFRAHALAALPGAHPVVAGDIDGDGDLDVLTAAFIPQAGRASESLASIVWLEQTRPGRFERRTLEVGRLLHATLDAADYDLDGDLDIVVGNFTAGDPVDAWVEIWENLANSPSSRR